MNYVYIPQHIVQGVEECERCFKCMHIYFEVRKPFCSVLPAAEIRMCLN